jgi:hypothetical protein
MAVTKQTYTATATWTPDTLADIFKQAFIGAGLMTDWYDEFTNTVKNCVLEVVYDNSKTYGTVYYWFMFTTGGVFISTTLGWNTTTNVPTGTQYLDYFSTTTNATTNHRTLISLTAATNCTLTRYTSAVNSGCSWFLIRNGSTNQAFNIGSPTYGSSSFIDQNKYAFNSFITTNTSTTSNTSSITFIQPIHLRRTYLGATSTRGATTVGSYNVEYYLERYSAFGNANATSNNWSSAISIPSIWLPTAFTNTQSGLEEDYNPVFTSPIVSPYQSPLPSDFGVVAYYASNTMAVQDTFVVSAGVEEWEIIVPSTNTNNASAAQLLFLARIV